MAAARRRNLLSSRRRVEDEGEDDDQVLGVEDDSASEVSVVSDVDEHSDVEASDLSDNDDASVPDVKKESLPIKTDNTSLEAGAQEAAPTAMSNDAASENVSKPSHETGTPTAFQATPDTFAMMNGLKPSGNDDQEGLNFEDPVETPPATYDSGSHDTVEKGKRETTGQRRAREHEEYRSRRDANPAFVPNRGGFFMHDHRHHGNDQQGPLPFGRGRGRGFPPNPRLPVRPIIPDATKDRWNHDLHETIIKPAPPIETKPVAVVHHESKPAPVPASNAGQLSLLSQSISLGSVMVRCCLPTTTRSAKFLKMTVRQHTRLPDLRPPLRRDKPVRISLAMVGPKYIFPSIERSFIFIPRAQRPNQQSFTSRARGPFGPSDSRGTSAYGGSGYEPSISISRRSSIIPDASMWTDGVMAFRAPAQPTFQRPVVRLPSNVQPFYVTQPVVTGPQSVLPTADDITTRPALALQEVSRETSTDQIPMHQPRPQKTVSLATMESPAHALNAPQQQEQQPFHQQVPAHMTGQMGFEESNATPAAQLPVSMSIGPLNPVSNIPDTAINAQPFQPVAASLQTMMPAPYAPDTSMYYYPNDLGQYPGAEGVTYIQQGPYIVPVYMPNAIPPEDGSGGAAYAQERNGMVYYYDPTQYGTEAGNDGIASYAVPGAGGMPTPGPEGYYYPQMPPNVAYYPSQ